MITFPNRKAIQHGASLFVNLPKLWCKHNNVKRRADLEVQWNEEDGSLIIRVKNE